MRKAQSLGSHGRLAPEMRRPLNIRGQLFRDVLDEARREHAFFKLGLLSARCEAGMDLTFATGPY